MTESERAASIEDGIANAFSRVLQEGRGGVTADTDFFEAGGNSILGAQLVAQLRQTLSVKVTIRDLFRARTASALAQVVRERAAATRSPVGRGRRAAVPVADLGTALAPVPLLCLPHAGAGAGFFRPWRDLTPTGLTLVPIQLPGRDELIDEEPYPDVASAVRGLESVVRAAAQPPVRVALFGHSFGAVLAFELARALESWRRGTVVRLFVSGSPGPWVGRESRATGLDDEQFLERVQEFAGFRHPAFDVPELRELILPTLRTDVCAHEQYLPLRDEQLDVPITCLRGAEDEFVSADEAATWREATTDELELVELPGGHMYLVDHAEELMTYIAERLSPLTAAVHGAGIRSTGTTRL